jgi:hypothetical protein
MYLELLFAGVFTSLEYAALLIAMGDETLQERFETNKMLAGLWASLAIITSEIGTGGGQIPTNLTITDMTRDGNNLNFRLNYVCPVTFNQVEGVFVNNHLLTTGASIDNIAAARRLAELRRAQEDFADNLAQHLIINGTRLAITIMYPPSALGFGLLDVLMSQGRSGSLSGVNQFLPEGAARDGATAGNFVLMETIKAIHGWNDVVNALNEAERERFLSWFGSGVATGYNLPGISDSSSAIPVFVGLYNPRTIGLMIAWQENGLGPDGARILNYPYDFNTILGIDGCDDHPIHPIFYGANEQEQADVLVLLNGGFSLITDSNDRMSMERFDEANNLINGMLNLDSSEGGPINIQFQNEVRRNDN